MTITSRPGSLSRDRIGPGPVAFRQRDAVSEPFCENCGTDEYLLYEDFAPARTLPGGRSAGRASVSYSCTQCGGFSGHDVPATWAPPNWFWYS